MFTVTQSFYNESIRKVVIAFGSLFESVYVTRFEEDGSEQQKIRVPLSYGSKEKFIWKLTQIFLPQTFNTTTIYTIVIL